MVSNTRNTTARLKWLAVLLLTGSLAACGGSDNNDDDQAGNQTPTPQLDPNVAETAQGDVRGRIEEHYIAFRGIPYAAPPTGSLRFQPPEDPAMRSSELDALEFGQSCTQPASTFGASSSGEDCLYLNVYRPKDDGNYPVMVWIHGGAFETGSGNSYDPARLVEEGLVVVTINYRLGILGFLAHPDLTTESSANASGDYGLMDQQKALQWVQNNIANFEGDPNNVTIFGESAGGHSVLSHLVSPESEGLFNKVIVQSGSYQPAQRTLAQAETQGGTIVTDLGCDTAPDVPACLRGLAASDFRAAQSANGYDYVPNTRPDILPNPIATALASGSYPQVPVLMGVNRDEWQLFIALNEISGGDLTDDEATFRSEINALTGIPTGSTTMDYLVTTAYDWDAAPFSGDVSLAMGALGTDAVFDCNALAQAQTTSGRVPTYVYEFADADAPSIIGTSWSFDLDAAHAFEIQYIFNDEETLAAAQPAGRGMTTDQVALANTMMTYWATFAKTGNPNPSSGAAPFWPNYATDAQFMKFEPNAVETITEAAFDTSHNCSAVWNAGT